MWAPGKLVVSSNSSLGSTRTNRDCPYQSIHPWITVWFLLTDWSSCHQWVWHWFCSFPWLRFWEQLIKKIMNTKTHPMNWSILELLFDFFWQIDHHVTNECGPNSAHSCRSNFMKNSYELIHPWITVWFLLTDWASCHQWVWRWFCSFLWLKFWEQ